jgi:hypothetical protein
LTSNSAFKPKRIFDILIYRCTERQYWAEQERDCAKYVRALGCDPASKAPYVIDIQQSWFEKYGGSWVNETIGVITLEASPGWIGGILHVVQYRKRITRRIPYKRMFYQGRFFNLPVWPQQENITVFHALRQELQLTVEAWPSLTNRVVDFEPLDTLGPFIDWVSLTTRSGP